MENKSPLIRMNSFESEIWRKSVNCWIGLMFCLQTVSKTGMSQPVRMLQYLIIYI